MKITKAEIYSETERLIKNSHHKISADETDWKCPKCNSDKVYVNRTRILATGEIKKQMQCKGCGKIHTVSIKVYRDYKKAKEKKCSKK